MNIKSFAAIPLVAWALFSLAGSAVAADGVAVKVSNDGTEDVWVTIYDNSTSPARTVLQQQRINGFTVVPIQVLADRSGKANLSWTAVATDGTSPKCGEARNVEVSDSDQLTISAADTCAE